MTLPYQREQYIPLRVCDTSGELDGAISAMYELCRHAALAEVEKRYTCWLMKLKTRRRVSASSMFSYPATDTIKYISMKLGKRTGNLTRLMKVKDMMLEEARKKAS